MEKQLYTQRGEQLSGTPWEVYSRPQMRRESYVNLNGEWEFENVLEDALAREYSKKICVPFCPESVLSGVQEHFPEGSILCYRRRFVLPEGFRKDRVLLHIGAADQVAQVYCNGIHLHTHKGGYNSFTVDITETLETENELVICCTDNLYDRSFPYGKQTQKRGGMWYTPVSGIWQTVWLESVPERYIEKLHIENRGYAVKITVEPAQNGTVTVKELGAFPLRDGSVVIAPENPHLWSPEDPYLYDFTVETETDKVNSYFAIRVIETKEIDGIPRLCLNGKPYFFHGLLDQGYWPDGIYTPADPACYKDDILAMKQLGFNTLRKHIKVEPEEFYYQCDQLGMVVFQDMVNNGDYSFFRDTALPTVGVQKCPDRRLHRDPLTRQRFLEGMEATVEQLKNHPCILYWTVFNEGWGQFDSDHVYDYMRKLDDTRIIDTTSGWFRRKKSDVESLHIYFGSWRKLKKGRKPLVLSEFGGYAYPEQEHLFNTDKVYGYGFCKTMEQWNKAVEKLYRTKILPAAEKGLCAAIITQVSDVEDEINGFLTYDRKVSKADTQVMQQLARELKSIFE